MLLIEPRGKERECIRIKERGVAAIREETHSPLYKPEIMLSFIFWSSCSVDMQG
jgi:hypothetical protein